MARPVEAIKDRSQVYRLPRRVARKKQGKTEVFLGLEMWQRHQKSKGKIQQI
jgi:hypothetical protein